MSITDALLVMSMIDGQCDDTDAGIARAVYLHEVLLSRPNSFWDTYWRVINMDDWLYQHCLYLLRNRAMKESTTFAELWH